MTIGRFVVAILPLCRDGFRVAASGLRLAEYFNGLIASGLLARCPL